MDTLQREQERERRRQEVGKRAGKRQRGRRVRLQFVLGSHSASIHPVTGSSNWIAEGQVGRGRGRGLEEKRKGGGGEWKRGDGVQRMQSRKMCRLLTSRCLIDEERRLTLTARPGLFSASAKWLLVAKHRIHIYFCITFHPNGFRTLKYLRVSGYNQIQLTARVD